MKLGVTAGTFDFLHIGHLLMLEEVRAQVDHLTVFLQTDPSVSKPGKNKPIETTLERFIRLKSCKYVDEVIPYDSETDLETLLKSTEYDVRFLSEEYRDIPYTGRHIKPEKHHYNSRNHSYSSSSLRKRIKDLS